LAITLNIHVYRDGEKNLGQNHLFNIGTIEAMEKTTGQAKEKLSL
jgi:hypothetical protein